MTCIAHRDVSVNGEVLEQPLVEHLHQTAMDARRMAEHFGAGQLMYAVGLLHDIGKADRRFQKYIRGEISDHVNHSSAGWRYALDMFGGLLKEGAGKQHTPQIIHAYLQFVGYLLVTHHGLMDVIDVTKPIDQAAGLFSGRLQYDMDGGYHYADDVVPFIEQLQLYCARCGEPSIKEALQDGLDEFVILYIRLQALSLVAGKMQKEAMDFYLGMLYRLLLSCLKEADIYDSANAFLEDKQRRFSENEITDYWECGCGCIEALYAKYESSPATPINEARRFYAEQAKAFAKQQRAGVYKLEMPTGSGKTMAVLRHALHHAAYFKSKKIIYLTAFLSVLEQNAREIRGVLGESDFLLEHHSNIVQEEDARDESRDDVKYAGITGYFMENWENPVILSTLVQFFNALFKHRARDIRKFRALADAVIIIDEVQSIPSKMLYLFNLSMNFMKTIMGCHIIHCTATQPVYDSPFLDLPLQYGNGTSSVTRIVDAEQSFSCFDRVMFKSLSDDDWLTVLSTEELVAHVVQQLELFDSALLIVNTKKACKMLYKALDERFADDEQVRRYYLTTNMCAAHRLDCIETIKKRLHLAEGKTICVSTQLIEAGVDVDFNVVYRSMAGLDRIVQSAGRCNREGRMEGKGICFLFRYAVEDLKYLQSLKQEADITMQVFRHALLDVDDLDIISVQDLYYHKYYLEHPGELRYPLKEGLGTMLDLLGTNQPKRDSYDQLGGNIPLLSFAQSFKTAAEKFDYIDQGAKTVIVSYQNEKLLENFHKAVSQRDLQQATRYLKKLQPYTVQIYLSDRHQPFIQKNEALDIYILEPQYYDEAVGMNIDSMETLIC